MKTHTIHRFAIAIGLFTLLVALNSSLASASQVPQLTVPPLVSSVGANHASADSGTRIPGRYIVVLKDTVNHPGDVAEVQTNRYDGDLALVYRHGIKGYSAKLSKSAVDALRSNPNVLYVAPDRKVELFSQTIPTGVERIGATENELADIDGEDKRVDVDIAVIDSGVSHTHPDLNVYKRSNCVPPGEGFESEEELELEECVENSGTDGIGHGTHVAGTVGALDNGDGVVGVAPGARLWAVKVFANDGYTTQSWIVAGVDYVTAHASEIEVANMSLGCGCAMPALESAINASVDAGVVYTVSAGNSRQNANEFSPAKNPNVITIAAMADYDGTWGGEAAPLTGDITETCEATHPYLNFGHDDTLASFSNFGSAVDIAAPGVCVLSTLPIKVGVSVGFGTGTSMAAPHVAGAAGLLASQANPNNKSAVEAIRQQLIDEGRQDWLDMYSWLDQAGNPHELIVESQHPLLDVRPPGPATYTSMASAINMTGAKLNGGSNPYGAETSFHFEYGTTTEYGQSTPVSPEEVPGGVIDVQLSKVVEGLKPNSTYHYRLVTTDLETEEVSYGSDRAFKTRPATVTESASLVGSHKATLNGLMNPLEKATSYYFEYGTGTEYGQSIPASPVSIGSGSKNVAVSQQITGLKAATTYHYRVVAVSKEEIDYGADQVFATTTSGFAADANPTRYKGELSTPSEFQVMRFRVIASANRSLLACQGGSLEGEESGATEALNLTPSFSNCYLNGLEIAVVPAMNGCKFELHPGVDVSTRLFGEPWGPEPKGTLDIGPPGCGPITYKYNSCTVTIPSQSTPLPGVEQDHSPFGKFVNSYTNWSALYFNKDLGGTPYVDAETGRGNLKYTVTNGGGCVPSGTYEDGTYQAHWHIKAFEAKPGGKQVAARVTNGFKAPPIATVEGAEDIEEKSAKLVGGVNPALLSTTAQYEYVTDAEFQEDGWSDATTLSISAGELGTGDQRVDVNREITGLQQGTTYHYRLFASNSEGTSYGEGIPGTGEGWTFTTTDSRPSAVTGPPFDIGPSEATLLGLVSANGLSTDAWFEYTTAADFQKNGWANATSVPQPPETFGSGAAEAGLLHELKGLVPGKTYQYRTVASNEAGTSYGEGMTFTTWEPTRFAAETASLQVGATTSEELRLETAAGELSCEEWSLSHSFEAPKSSMTLSMPASIPCEFFGLEVNTITNGCEFILHSGTGGEVPTEGFESVGTLDISCPAGKSIGFNLSGCSLSIPPQTGIGPVVYENAGTGSGRKIEASLSATKVKYTLSGVLCGSGTYTNGGWFGGWELSGTAGGKAKGLWVENVPRKPLAATESATNVKTTQATLNATVNPEGSSTSYWFEYGKTTSYGTKVPVTPAALGSGIFDLAVSQTPTGLSQNTTYHYRVVAENAAGTIQGKDRTLTTLNGEAAIFEAATEGDVRLGAAQASEYQILETELGEIVCEEFDASGTAANLAVEVRLTPFYDKCEAFGLLAEVDVNGCSLNLHAGTYKTGGKATGWADLDCPASHEVEISVTGCTVKLPPQSNLQGVEYEAGKAKPQDIAINASLSGVEYSYSGTLCGTGTSKNGIYTGKATVSAVTDDEAEEAVALAVVK